MRFVALLSLLAVGVAGCQTASHNLALEQLVDLRVADISVSVADGLPISQEFRDAIPPKVKAAMERQLSPRLKGSTPVRVEVTVRGLSLADQTTQLLVGGAHTLTADVTLIDLRTKAVLLRRDAQSSHVGGGAGIVGGGIIGGVGGLVMDRAVLPRPVDRLAESFAFQYAEWLKPSEPRS
jgi:hypothetical protein